MAVISSSINNFALDLLRTLSDANQLGNMFLSPLSIRSIQTSTQALSFHLGKDFHAEFKKLIEDINSPSTSYNLKTANRLYGMKTEKFLTQYMEDTRKYYQADLKTVDFIGAMEASRVEINTWVQKQTENKIQDLLKAGIVSAETKLVLVNAIYLKATWMNRFYTRDTEKRDFRVTKTEIKPVQMMKQTKNLPYNYITDHALHILELPYEKEELSMFILLPKESKHGSEPLVKLVKELTLERLNEWTDRENMDVQSDILVHLPKFKLEENYELNEPLSKLGMTKVFRESEADLSGMNSRRDLFLSEVIHKAFVAVNEKGTEAAAATAVGMTGCCGPNERKVLLFKADHPFLFFIRHNKTKSILFLGRFSSPQ